MKYLARFLDPAPPPEISEDMGGDYPTKPTEPPEPGWVEWEPEDRDRFEDLERSGITAGLPPGEAGRRAYYTVDDQVKARRRPTSV